MKRSAFLTLLLAGASFVASAQTPPTSAATPTPVVEATPVSSVDFKLPAGIPTVDVPFQTAFALRYQDITVGTGALAEPNKLYRVHYTGWLASDGSKFDSSFDHPASPVIGKDGKPEDDADGKPKTAAAQPLLFAQGMRQMLPGFDQGFGGMHIGGKRRLFIPWQLAYGAQGRPTGDPKKPGIPAKADLIFDIELVDVSEIPARPQPAPPPPHNGSAFPFKNGMPPGVAPPAGASTPGTAPNPAANSAAPAASGGAPAAAPAAAPPAAPASAVPAQSAPATPTTPAK